MKDVYLFKGERAWFILAVWFMATLSLLTMCSEGLRSWGDKAAIKEMWAELRYKPTNATYVHFFDNGEGTNNTHFFYTNVSSSGRISEFVDVRRHCYRWRVHHVSKDHTKVLRKITDRGNIRFGLEKGFAYLFLDRYRPDSETCKAMATIDPTPLAEPPEGKQPAGTGLATPPTTVRIGPFGTKKMPLMEKSRAPRERRNTRRRNYESKRRIIGPGTRTLGHGTTLRQDGATYRQGPGR